MMFIVAFLFFCWCKCERNSFLKLLWEFEICSEMSSLWGGKKKPTRKTAIISNEIVYIVLCRPSPSHPVELHHCAVPTASTCGVPMAVLHQPHESGTAVAPRCSSASGMEQVGLCSWVTAIG